jgi:hypothetical protein
MAAAEAGIGVAAEAEGEQGGQGPAVGKGSAGQGLSPPIQEFGPGVGSKLDGWPAHGALPPDGEGSRPLRRRIRAEQNEQGREPFASQPGASEPAGAIPIKGDGAVRALQRSQSGEARVVENPARSSR